MACNCKNTITSFLGGDIANPTTFLNCGEADGTYNNPLETGKTQCIAENNVLRILDDYKISGTVKNSGQIVFERTVTGDTSSTSGVWETSADGNYLIPIVSVDGAGQVSGTSIYAPTLSSTSLTTPNITIGKESGVISATTIVGKFSGVTEAAAGAEITMTTALYRPNMVIDVRMGANNSMSYILPEVGEWNYGKYTFIFGDIPHATSSFILNCNSSDRFYGLTTGLDANEIISNATTITFANGTTIRGTRIDVIASSDELVLINIWSAVNVSNITPS